MIVGVSFKVAGEWNAERAWKLEVRARAGPPFFSQGPVSGSNVSSALHFHFSAPALHSALHRCQMLSRVAACMQLRAAKRLSMEAARQTAINTPLSFQKNLVAFQV
jgi:hypothetical protein